VRRRAPAEWSVVREGRLAALLDAPGAFASSYERERSDAEDGWRDRIARHACLVAEAHGRQVGLAVVKPSYDGIPHRRDLISMWVHPAHRGRGVAARLVGAAVDRAAADGAREVALWVVDGNAVAAAVYRRAGFVPTGRRQPLPSNPAVGEEEWLLPIPARSAAEHHR
jgi:GNAT superfamily N-acetyltransferase